MNLVVVYMLGYLVLLVTWWTNERIARRLPLRRASFLYDVLWFTGVIIWLVWDDRTLTSEHILLFIVIFGYSFFELYDRVLAQQGE